jgi:hypothetical protein
MTPGELQSLLKDGSLLSVSRMNKDGGWEKVVAVENDLSSRKGPRSTGYSSSEDLERLNWAKQSQAAAVIEEEVHTELNVFIFYDNLSFTSS